MTPAEQGQELTPAELERERLLLAQIGPCPDCEAAAADNRVLVEALENKIEEIKQAWRVYHDPDAISRIPTDEVGQAFLDLRAALKTAEGGGER